MNVLLALDRLLLLDSLALEILASVDGVVLISLSVIGLLSMMCRASDTVRVSASTKSPAPVVSKEAFHLANLHSSTYTA